MAALFQLKNPSLPAPAPGTKVVKAAEYAEFCEADRIIEAALERARAIEAKAEAEYEARREAGYADGVEQGRMAHAEKMMETVLASVEFIEKIESTVVDVVTQSVRKIVGDLDEDERIRRIVATALAHVRGEQKVVVRVAPSDEPAVSAALAAMTSGAYLNVVADPRLKPSSCILESNLGVIDASLETQLKALEHAFTAKIKQQ